MSAPQRVDQTSFSTSSSMEEVTAELPILAFTFTEEVAADNHRFRLRVVDVGGDDGASGGHFIANELGVMFSGRWAPKPSPACCWRRTSLRIRSRPMFSRMAMNSISGVTIPPAGVVQLGNAFASDGAFGRQQAAEAQLIETVVGQPRFGIGRAAFAERRAVVTRVDPRLAQLCQPLADINANIRVAIRPGGVIHRDRFVGFVPGLSLSPPTRVGLS